LTPAIVAQPEPQVLTGTATQADMRLAEPSRQGERSMAKFTRRDFIKASVATGIVAGAVAAPALLSPFGRSVVATGASAKPPLPEAISSLSSTFNLNGARHTVAHEARTTLWEVISEQIGLTGTVRSCNRATCGVCTVVVDGTAYYSCHMLAFEAAEKPILTVEGLGTADALDPIQEIGIRNMAADCGYCTAGWLTVAKTYLQKNPNPTDQDIKDMLAGHLCRCAAYAGIIKTVKDTASYMRGEVTL
jgi:aerobic-type carbon monoxide dehydrogenase small subunit (CoxS/CutS family)